MSIQELQEAEQMLRTVELRRSVHGVDPEHARQLLEQAADLLATAAREHEKLNSELKRLREATDEAAVGKALVTATLRGNALIAEAEERAASLTTEAEAQASALLEQVRAQAEQLEKETEAARGQLERELREASRAQAKVLEAARTEADTALEAERRELGRLETQAARLSSVVADMERRIVEVARDALDELETLEASFSNSTADDLLTDLRPTPETSNVPVE